MLGLIAVGTAILNAGALGVTDEGKILLKTVHVRIGYVLAISSLLLLLLSQAVTGPVLAGTDLFYPPLGAWIASWIAEAAAW